MLRILLACFLITTSLSAWDKSVEKNGITVFTRNVENSSLKEFRAVTDIRVKPVQIVSALIDADSMKEWWPDCLESKVLNKNGYKNWTVYFLTKVPFPLNNRDTINRFELTEESNGTVQIRIKAMPNLIPEKDGIVRIPELTGSWTIVPKGEGSEVTYQLHANPGGSIPAFVANSTVTDSPYKALAQLKEVVQKSKHSEADWKKL